MSTPTQQGELSAREIAEKIAETIGCIPTEHSCGPCFEHDNCIVLAIEAAPTAATARGEASMREFRPTHRHYKGGIYQVLFESATHTETSAPLTIYRNEAGHIYARPYEMFNEQVFDEHGDPVGDRFRALKGASE